MFQIIIIILKHSYVKCVNRLNAIFYRDLKCSETTSLHIVKMNINIVAYIFCSKLSISTISFEAQNTNKSAFCYLNMNFSNIDSQFISFITNKIVVKRHFERFSMSLYGRYVYRGYPNRNSFATVFIIGNADCSSFVSPIPKQYLRCVAHSRMTLTINVFF